MSAERLEDTAARLNLSAEVLADHLWEQGVPAIDAGMELTAEMVVAAETFASRFAPTPQVSVPSPDPVPVVDASPEAEGGSGEAAEEPGADGAEEVHLRSGVRRRRRRTEAPE